MNCPHNKVRVQALRAWMELQGLNYRSVAREIGVSAQYIGYILGGTQKMPAARRDQLITLGIPEHLLPVSGNCSNGQSGPGRTA